MNEMSENTEHWKKLVPFAKRARLVLTGREKLAQNCRKLAFIIITDDISENSRDEALRSYSCPIYQLLTMTEVDALFGFKGTKMLGMLKSDLASSMEKDLQEYKINI